MELLRCQLMCGKRLQMQAKPTILHSLDKHIQFLIYGKYNENLVVKDYNTTFIYLYGHLTH